MEYITMTVEVRGREFDIEVYAKISSGGSSSWGSDEPRGLMWTSKTSTIVVVRSL